MPPKEEKKKKPAAKKGDGEKKPKKVPAAVRLILAQQEAQRKLDEENKRREEEEEAARLKAIEDAKRAEEERLAKVAAAKAERARLKAEGKILTESQKRAKAEKAAHLLAMVKSGQVSQAVYDELMKKQAEKEAIEATGEVPVAKPKKVKYEDKRKKPHKPKEASDAVSDPAPATTTSQDAPVHDDSVPASWDEEEETAASAPAAAPITTAVEPEQQELQVVKGDVLRSPICCVLGHVDTGKTKLLDKIRRTNVQGGEAGGITQQIGATYFPLDSIREQTQKLRDVADKILYNIPGLLIMDTPGHESFTNLRSRGANLCDIAVLVVDIMHGLEQQTIESINLLKAKGTPFVVALNKIDRMYDWQSSPNRPSQIALKAQQPHVVREFEDRVRETITAFAVEGLNAELYYKNKDFRNVISLVPTSAMTGEGIPDLLMILVQLTQKMMSKQLILRDELQCTVLEVKMLEGLGHTIDVVLVNGTLYEGDTFVICGLDGPIVTQVRSLLTPQPMKEMRVKSPYVHHKSLQAAIGAKISAHSLEKAVAGSSLYVCKTDAEIDAAKAAVMADLDAMRKRLDKQGRGVYVQASTLGSLEALLDYLRTVKIPVCDFNIGPVHKSDVVKASVMLEHKVEWASILAFDVLPNVEAKKLAEKLGVKIFCADIIYHLQDQFKKYIDDLERVRIEAQKKQAVFPCELKIVPGCIFNAKDPIVLGVDVKEGSIRLGTPLCVCTKDNLEIGTVIGIENNHRPVEVARAGTSVAIKIQPGSSSANVMAKRHFDEEDTIVSLVSRTSIDMLKEHFRDDVTREEWKLVIKLKKLLKID